MQRPPRQGTAPCDGVRISRLESKRRTVAVTQAASQEFSPAPIARAANRLPQLTQDGFREVHTGQGSDRSWPASARCVSRYLSTSFRNLMSASEATS
jgi:hypothetical protein